MPRADIRLLLPLLLLLAGCAAPVPGLFGTAPPAGPFRDPSLTVQEAARAIAVGHSDKASVHARLGPAERLAFASGYEVWVYRARAQAQGAPGPELVILFDPAGKVSKLRALPA